MQSPANTQLQSKHKILRLYTALTTAFSTQNTIDYFILKNHIKYLIDNNSGIILFGTTSECPTITNIERNQIMEIIKNDFKPHIHKFIIGVGGNDTNECIKNMIEAHNFEFNNIMITVPYYNRPSQHGIYMHMSTIANEHLKLNPNSNVMMYNVPSRCGTNMEPSTVKKIYDHCPNVRAIKEASGNLTQIMNIIHENPNLKVFSGDDLLTIPILSIGGYGLCSVISNAFPTTVLNIIETYKTDTRASLKSFYELMPYISILSKDTNPVPIKHVLKILNMYPNDYVRLPLSELSDENKKSIDDVYHDYVNFMSLTHDNTDHQLQ